MNVWWDVARALKFRKMRWQDLDEITGVHCGVTSRSLKTGRIRLDRLQKIAAALDIRILISPAGLENSGISD